MFPDFYDPIVLSAWAFCGGQWRECEILDADAVTQTATIQPRGSYYQESVPFRRIQNVALKGAVSGRVLQNFGAPRVSNPDSLAYAIGWRDAYVGV